MNPCFYLASAGQGGIIHWPGQGDLLNWCQEMGPATAMLLIVGGIVYMLWGLKVFKILMTVNAGLVGMYIGGLIGSKMGSVTAGTRSGGIGGALLAWPSMKYSVAIIGGLFGGLMGATIWRMADLDVQYCWAGALIGLISFGMLSFILFRASIIMYTSLQGGVMLILGILGMCYKYNDIAPHINKQMSGTPYLLLIAVLIPALVGLIYQQQKGPAGAGSAGGSGTNAGGSEGKKK
jgi:hypothetical protein